ncbi:MAG: Blue-light-activated protein [Verrucomicrobia bacterium ADurb.Bin345]|nr:MAG: Blue-light-activated protein [Verrucomicrobia bacterium ADurb.Bin345]
MKKESPIKDLEAEKARLVRSLNLFRLAEAPGAPSFMADLDFTSVRELLGGEDFPWGNEGLFPESAACLVFLQNTDAGKRRLLESEIEILSAALKGADVTMEAPLGFKEAIFPILVQNTVVHCIRSGKFREGPFNAQQVAEFAEQGGLSAEKAEALARSVPVLPAKQRERLLDVCARLRSAVAEAISQQIHAGSLTEQLVQSERTHSLGTLSGGVAHHFNNLLSVILGYSSYVLNRERLSKDASESLHKISEAAQRGRRLTEEILAFLGSEVEENVPCHIHETVTSVLSLLESKTGASVRVETSLKATSDTVVAEPSAIRQIIFNLLTNAIDSMPGGGVLSVKTTNVGIQGEGGKQECLRLEVMDSGGMPVSQADMAAAAGARTVQGRMAMKLSSVYGMVGRLDGTVVVAAEPGTATRVEVLLPTAKVGAAVVEERKTRHRLVPSEIWVVDDDPIFREMCRQVLSDDGHSVQEASGGREFMNLWRTARRKADLIIMDFSMPEYNGLQLCQWLRDEGAKTPVILVSGFAANQPDIKKALKLKKTHFLQKPFSFREMADTVTVALGETLIGA